MPSRATEEWRVYYRERYQREKEKTRSTLSDVLCACGCGQHTQFALSTKKSRGQIKGRPLTLVNGHNMNILNRDPAFVQKRREGNKTFEARLNKARGALRGSREVILSPYIPDCMIRFAKQSGYWNCRVHRNGKIEGTHHAKAVYEYHYGSVPDGYEVHHIDGQHALIEDDRPENLVAIPQVWNRDYITVLITGLRVSSEIVTRIYLEVREEYPEAEQFKEVCKRLLDL